MESTSVVSGAAGTSGGNAGSVASVTPTAPTVSPAPPKTPSTNGQNVSLTKSAPVAGETAGAQSGAAGGSDTSGQVVTGGDTGVAQTQQSQYVALDPELERFASGKGYDASKLTTDPVLMKAVEAQRSMEAEMNRLRDNLRKYEHTEQADGAVAAAAAQVDGTQQAVELSPMQQLDQEFGTILDNLAYFHGLNSASDVQTALPEVFAKLQNDYQLRSREILPQEVAFHAKTGKKAETAQQSKQKFEADMQRASSAMRQNVDQARQAGHQNIERDLVASGAQNFVGALCKQIGIPSQFLMAVPPLFQFVAKASKAIVELENADKPGGLIERTLAERKAAKELSARANLASPDMELPTPEQLAGSGDAQVSPVRSIATLRRRVSAPASVYNG